MEPFARHGLSCKSWSITLQHSMLKHDITLYRYRGPDLRVFMQPLHHASNTTFDMQNASLSFPRLRRNDITELISINSELALGLPFIGVFSAKHRLLLGSCVSCCFLFVVRISGMEKLFFSGESFCFFSTAANMLSGKCIIRYRSLDRSAGFGLGLNPCPSSALQCRDHSRSLIMRKENYQ